MLDVEQIGQRATHNVNANAKRPETTPHEATGWQGPACGNVTELQRNSRLSSYVRPTRDRVVGRAFHRMAEEDAA